MSNQNRLGELLVREKEHTRQGDDLARQRRELPWVPVDKEYRFETDEGTRTLAELFDGRSQLLVYHFMFGPSYEAGCPTCSSMIDGLDGPPGRALRVPGPFAQGVQRSTRGSADLARRQPAPDRALRATGPPCDPIEPLRRERDRNEKEN